MGKNALDACSYAQLRADEASDYLLEMFKNRSVIKWLFFIICGTQTHYNTNLFP